MSSESHKRVRVDPSDRIDVLERENARLRADLVALLYTALSHKDAFQEAHDQYDVFTVDEGDSRDLGRLSRLYANLGLDKHAAPAEVVALRAKMALDWTRRLKERVRRKARGVMTSIPELSFYWACEWIQLRREERRDALTASDWRLPSKGSPLVSFAEDCLAFLEGKTFPHLDVKTDVDVSGTTVACLRSVVRGDKVDRKAMSTLEDVYYDMRSDLEGGISPGHVYQSLADDPVGTWCLVAILHRLKTEAPVGESD